jgi:hypothetical protein
LGYARGVRVPTSLFGLTSGLAFALVLIASGACSSVPDITFDDVDGGSSGSSGGPCVATGAEICGDGRDNDCNGKADCADPACEAKSSCVDGVPAGWQVVAFAEGARPPCPEGFDESTDVTTVVGASGAAVCGCSCTGSTTCAAGSLGVALGATAACATSTESLALTTGCGQLNGPASFAVGANTFIKVTAPPPPTCNGTPTSTVTPLREGRVCAPRANDAGGCAATAACAPRVSAGYALCVQKAGSNECPPAFAVARHAGTSATDTRACSACSCVSMPCAVKLTLYDKVNCGAAQATAMTSATCSQIANAAFSARGYETTVSGGCGAASTPLGTGSLVLAGETTVCCK